MPYPVTLMLSQKIKVLVELALNCPPGTSCLPNSPSNVTSTMSQSPADATLPSLHSENIEQKILCFWKGPLHSLPVSFLPWGGSQRQLPQAVVGRGAHSSSCHMWFICSATAQSCVYVLALVTSPEASRMLASLVPAQTFTRSTYLLVSLQSLRKTLVKNPCSA